MEDIKNIENAKARAETFMKNRKNKKRNEKYTPGFIEMAVKFLNKTPAEAGLFDASPRSAKARAKAKETSKKTTVSDKQKASSQVRKIATNRQNTVRNGERDMLKGENLRKDKNYNVGVSKGGVPFKEAFAHFRKKGAKTFTWNGEKYTTELKKPKGKK
jgi:hypothetical protein